MDVDSKILLALRTKVSLIGSFTFGDELPQQDLLVLIYFAYF